ncbi:predicted protein [Sclerotinia sclerotiorum 1980 UF-70]|uniref:Uncharacterized protein n=1 Tax=Sclerotinia sclerotiorum (strain ATCC 18683 / 1980 / Ss-1) TaxID=665079 RepID=A7F762_SCLS1|nr:predicted protein [Sclerotinia sclerotiorum 1980 UF-70]EDN98583.1 predicted protein [Sclerotinia sclerotiorum 1980 UF-70]
MTKLKIDDGNARECTPAIYVAEILMENRGSYLSTQVPTYLSTEYNRSFVRSLVRSFPSFPFSGVRAPVPVPVPVPV